VDKREGAFLDYSSESRPDVQSLHGRRNERASERAFRCAVFPFDPRRDATRVRFFTRAFTKTARRDVLRARDIVGLERLPERGATSQLILVDNYPRSF